MDVMRLRASRTVCFILSIIFALLTTQVISINYSNFSAEGYQPLKYKVPRIMQIQGDNNDEGIEIAVPPIN